MKLSVCIATFNEANNISDCLSSVKDLADEIVIVDGKSTDDTVKIAKKFKATIHISENNQIFHIQKQLAVDKANGDWVLVLDADERVTPELGNEIRQVIDSDAQDNGFWIKRRKQFLGRWIKKGGQYPDPVIRLFRKGKGRHPQKSVHEQIEIDGSVGWLSHELLHLPSPSFAVYITKDNRYSTLFAKDLLSEDPGLGLFSFLKYFIFTPLFTFINMYIRHRGYTDGFPGFVFAFYSGLTHASAYVKYFEFKQNPKTKDNILVDWI